MGQQQLLLVILVTILVGIATVVAINTFGSSNINANRDAVRNDIAAIATAAQAWYIKPEMLGGGNNTFTGLTFDDIGFAADTIYNSGLTARNLNGVYLLEVTGAQAFTITANPSSNVTAGADSVVFVGSATPSGLTIAEE